MYDFVKARKAEKQEDWSKIDGAKAKETEVSGKTQMDPIYDYSGEVNFLHRILMLPVY